MSDTKIKRIPRKLAAEFLARFEILGNVGLGVWHWGLWHESDLISVITFGTPCFGGKRGWISNVAEAHGAKVLQLCRGGTVPGAPRGAPSRAISLATREMRALHGSFLAVAYADETLGEIGTIYQASGAFYTGKTKPKGQANYLIEGEVRSAWQVRRNYGTRDRRLLAQIDPAMQVVPLTPKHRYMFVSAAKTIRRAILRRTAPYVQPYPKRAPANKANEFRYGYVDQQG